MKVQPKRKLRVNLTDLDQAIENTDFEHQFYLDLETGEVVLVDEETRSELERIYEELNEAGDGEFKHIERAIAESEIADWQKELVLEAHRVEEGCDTRYLTVPTADSHDGYEDMEDYIETVRDDRLQERLQDAIHGRGAFRRFKDVLGDYPEARESWFKFRDDRVRQRALDWLENEGIEAILE